MNMPAIRYALGSLTLVLLTACGGGGGGGSSVDSTAPTLALTADNASAVTSEILASALSTSGADLGTLPPVTLSIGGSAAGLNSASILYQALQPLLAQSSRGATGALGITQTVTFDCAQGGSASGSVTYVDQATTELVPGDKVTLEADNCAFYESIDGNQVLITLNGYAAVTIEPLSDFPPRADFPTHESWSGYNLGFEEMEQYLAVFTDFRITLSGAEAGTVTLNGTARLKNAGFTTSGPEYEGISGSFGLDADSGGNSASFSLGDGNLESLTRVDGNSQLFSETLYSGRYSSSTLGGTGGRVTISTQQDLIHDDASDAPLSQGRMKVLGANNSSLVITIPGQSSHVQLDVDSSGDGTIDTTLNLYWADLNVQ